jgi:GH18 family chitinase
LYERIVKLKEKNPELKILISTGGWGQASQFEGIVGSEEIRFVVWNVKKVVIYNKLD